MHGGAFIGVMFLFHFHHFLGIHRVAPGGGGGSCGGVRGLKGGPWIPDTKRCFNIEVKRNH